VEYLTGQLNEVADRYADPGLGYQNHRRIRHRTIGVGPSLCLAERVARLDVPDLAWHSSHLEQMRLLAVDHVIAVNEVYSLEKEEAQNAPNLVRFLMREQALSRGAAIRRLHDEADERFRQYTELEHALPRLCKGLGLSEAEADTVRRYAGAISAWVRGNYEWHRAAGRYKTAAAEAHAAHVGALNTEDLSSLRRAGNS
jgi:hypothetical protein